MNSWAASGAYNCHFLCVCVLGDRGAYPLCKQMSTGSKLTHCVNGFIDNQIDGPSYGQLGCQGFIVLDEKHKVVAESTTAFMQYRDLAFDHVEALLDAVCNGRPPPAVCPGELCELVEAPEQRPDLKGAKGLCVKVTGSTIHFGTLRAAGDAAS